jgi:hypothetical protein
MTSTLNESVPVEVSIVIPARNEEDNVEPLISEILAALDGDRVKKRARCIRSIFASILQLFSVP